FQAEDGIRVFHVTGVQTCALPISCPARSDESRRSGARGAVAAAVHGDPRALRIVVGGPSAPFGALADRTRRGRLAVVVRDARRRPDDARRTRGVGGCLAGALVPVVVDPGVAVARPGAVVTGVARDVDANVGEARQARITAATQRALAALGADELGETRRIADADVLFADVARIARAPRGALASARADGARIREGADVLGGDAHETF